MHYLNEFGHRGGFDLLEKLIRTGESFDLNIIGTLIEIVSRPYALYHRDFSHEYTPKIVELA
jgi:hypothetical protein